MKNYLYTAAALACVLGSGSAWATPQTQTAALPVTALITNACSVNTATLAFGQVAVSGTTNGTGTINVTCTIGGTYAVSLDSGQNALLTQRRVLSSSPVAGSYLNYNVYTDAARTLAWGTTAATGTTGIGTGSAVSYSVYGQIPAGQSIVVGNYSDSVTVTVTY